jgi:hypothetical protein
MAQHRMNCRRSGVRPSPESPGQLEPASSRGVSVEETAIPDVDRFGKPAGFGTEASTSSTSFEVLDTYSVPAGSLARVRSASVSLDSEGEALIGVDGTTFGPFTGGVDVEVPLDPSVLVEGGLVRVLHRSTSGNSTTTRALVVASEV